MRPAGVWGIAFVLLLAGAGIGVAVGKVTEKTPPTTTTSSSSSSTTTTSTTASTTTTSTTTSTTTTSTTLPTPDVHDDRARHDDHDRPVAELPVEARLRQRDQIEQTVGPVIQVALWHHQHPIGLEATHKLRIVTHQHDRAGPIRKRGADRIA